MSKLQWLIVSILCLLVAAGAGAQPEVKSGEEAKRDGVTRDFRVKVRDLPTSDPATRALGRAPSTAEGWRILADWRLLDDFNLKLKGFTASETDSGFGLSYDYSKSIPAHYIHTEPAYKTLLDFAFEANGNVAFDQSQNVEDFLDTKGKFGLIHTRGGVNKVARAGKIAATTDRDLGFALLNELEDAVLDDPGLSADFDKMIQSQEWAQLAGAVSQRLSTQYFYQLDFDGGIESNQDFSNFQWTAGLQGGVEVKAWNPESAWAHLNVFDYPFAAIRLLSGDDATWTPDGLALPAVLFAYDHVWAADDAGRAVLTTKSDYDRISAEVSFRSLIARLGRTRIFFDLNYRYYYEIDAPATVKAAGQDDFYYLQLAATSSQGIFFSYGRGQLPFDQVTQDVYQIGWKVNTDALKGLLGR